MKSLFNRFLTLLLAACAGLFFIPLAARALWDSDEGRYAEIAREMVAVQDWLVPRLNGVLYFEKPPMAYWVTALGLKLFGINAFGARFFSAVFGLLTVGVVCWIGRAWRHERTGILAGGILATSVGFFVLTQYLVVDMVLTFWLTLALGAQVQLLREQESRKITGYALLCAAAIAGGFLTKGLIALLLPVAIFALTCAAHRLTAQARRIPWSAAVAFFFLLAAPWFVWISRRYDFYAPFFFIHEHFARYFTKVHQRDGAVYYFVPVVLIGFLPWIFFLPRTLWYWLAGRAAALRQDPVAALLVIWAGFIFAFFSLSGSKLPAYMLPVFPALALLVADAFDRVFEELMPAWMSWGLDALIVFFIALLALLKWLPAPHFMTEAPFPVIVEQGAGWGLTLAVCILILVGVWGMRRTSAVFGGVLIAQALFLSSVAALAVSLDPLYSTHRLAQVIATRAAPQDRVVVYGVSYETYTQTLAFYTARRIAIYGPVGEFALGAAHAADAPEWFADGPAATDALLKSPPGTWVVTNDEFRDKLKAEGHANHFETVATSGRLHLLQKTE